MTKINPESEFRFEFRTYCKGVARHHAEDDIQKISDRESDFDKSEKEQFYIEEKDEIRKKDERYRQAKQQVSALPFDMAFDAIETPATVAAFEENHTALFWKLEETPTFSDLIYLDRKQIVLAWIGERLKALNESDRPAGAIPTDDKAAPATGEPESQPAAKVSIDGKEAPATGPEDQNPLSSLKHQELALWCYYRQEAGEMESFIRKKAPAVSFAESQGKSGKTFYNYWKDIQRTSKKRTPLNISYHKVILPFLEKDSPIAFNEAYKALKELEKTDRQ